MIRNLIDRWTFSASAWVMGAWLLVACSEHDRTLELQHLVAVDPPRAVADFALVDQHGRSFDAGALRGRWSVLFVGFTFCPDICPTTLGLLAGIEKRLPESDRPLEFVFVTIDPERDVAARLAEYIDLFNPAWTGLGGGKDQIDALLASLGLAYVKVPLGNGDYTMDHSTALVLIDPEARMAGFYPAPLDAAALVSDFSALQRCPDCAL